MISSQLLVADVSYCQLLSTCFGTQEVLQRCPLMLCKVSCGSQCQSEHCGAKVLSCKHFAIDTPIWTLWIPIASYFSSMTICQTLSCCVVFNIYVDIERIIIIIILIRIIITTYMFDLATATHMHHMTRKEQSEPEGAGHEFEWPLGIRFFGQASHWLQPKNQETASRPPWCSWCT